MAAPVSNEGQQRFEELPVAPQNPRRADQWAQAAPVLLSRDKCGLRRLHCIRIPTHLVGDFYYRPLRSSL